MSAATISITAALALVLLTPAAGDPVALAAQTAAPAAIPFNGTAAVGALFVDKGGKLTHFCTASVVHSPHGNLLITAAHCMQGKSLKPAGRITFAPGYHDGKFPHGRWLVRAVYVNSAWKKNQNPNDDVAFLLAGRPGLRIEKYTGAETLETNASLPQQVRVIGYPDLTNLPVTCDAPARAFLPNRPRQLVFDCGGYTNGTSGGPFLAHVSKKTGAGKVMGVIGGFEQGGDTPAVSYSARFLANNVPALYKSATR
jgi:V8-like Glu-specific endopeptidase